MDSPKERDQRDRDRAMRAQHPTDYMIRHGIVGRDTWWLCPRCCQVIPPWCSHRHLR